jgi:Rrf2 family protein
MRKDSRLSRMLHMLLHMARHDHLFTSEQIAEMLQTNPVVVRRTLSGLKKAGYVTAKKGPTGGWRIACDLEKTSLLDIYTAVGNPPLFAMGYDHSDPVCAVERVINQALDDTLSQAEALIMQKLGNISLAQLLKDFDVLCS